MSPSSPKRFSQTYEDEGSNRFTLTDYVYDREDEQIHAQRTDQIGGPSRNHAYEEKTEYIEYPEITLRPPDQRDRPSSWGLALQSEIAQIRGSIAYPPAAALPIMPNTASKDDTTPKRLGDSSDSPERSPSVRPDMSQFFRRRPPIDVSALPPPTHLSPGPAISPSSNEAIRRLPPIPTTTPPTSPPGSSGSIRRLPTLPTTISSSSIASSQPSPLLPPFQLASPKEYQPRPSLATMPSSGETEMEALPSLPWAERERNISFVEGKESAAEKGGRTERMRSEPREKIWRWWQWIIPESLFCKLLLGTVVIELMIDIIIEANILWRFNLEVRSSNSTQVMLENKRRLPIFLIIFGLAHLWQLILTIIAIRTKNTIQISAITIFNFAFLAWAVIQVSELRQILGDLQTSLIDDEPGSTDTGGGQTSLLNLPLNVLTAVIIGVVATCCLVLSILAYFVRREFGWQRYRFLGADLQIRGYYRRFQVLECLIYFSAFFTAGFGIQFIWLVLQRDDAEYIITWIMFPLSLILLVIGRTAAKYENKPFMIFFCCGLTLGEAYFIFKLTRIWQQSTTVYSNVSKSLTVFAVLSILSLMACLVGSILVYRDFGKGLKGAVLSQYPKSPRVGFNRWRTTDEELQATQSSKSSKRISID